MNRFILILSGMLLALTSCKQVPEPFDFVINGSVRGMDQGEISLCLSMRAGDEVAIPVEQGKFRYQGKAFEISRSMLLKEDSMGLRVFQMVIEPGEIVLDVSADSMGAGSRVIRGLYNIEYQEVRTQERRFSRYDKYGPDVTREDSIRMQKCRDSMASYCESNAQKISTVMFMEGDEGYFLNHAQVGKILSKITNPKVKRSKYYKMCYSRWLSETDSVGKVGTQAKDFALPDSSGKIIRFKEFNKANLTFVDWSGSWCGNSTRASLELKPLYEKYHPLGFDIITIVKEFRYDRWMSWLQKYDFPWTMVVELDDNNPNQLFYYDYLFPDLKKYLVDGNNMVIANDLNPARLNEILMEHYYPEEYAGYVKNKWELPEGVRVLDRDTSIDSVEELLEAFQGKTLLLDFWATWCQPCIAEFLCYQSLWPFLEEKHIELIYLVDDGYKAEGQWLDYLRKYSLKGSHVRINANLGQSLRSAGYLFNTLPTYMIVNKAGKLAESDAARPSESEKLKSQLVQAAM